MYLISNSDRESLIKLISVLLTISGTDTRSANIRRKAKLSINKLSKAKKQPNGKTHTRAVDH